jgi:microcystin-dependent protein
VTSPATARSRLRRSCVGANSHVATSARALAAISGEETHTLSATEGPAHTHLHDASGEPILTASSWGLMRPADAESALLVPVVNGSTRGSSSTAVNSPAGGAHNNMQPFAVVNQIVKIL